MAREPSKDVDPDADENAVLDLFRRRLRRRVRETVAYQKKWARRFKANRVAHGCEFPRVMSAARYRDVCERGQLVTYYLRAAGQLAFDGSYTRLSRFLCLSDDEHRFFEAFWTPSFDAPLSRPDMLVWGDQVAILEANICSSIGGYSHEHLRAYLADHPVWGEIASERGIRIPSPYDGVATLLRLRRETSIGMIDVPDVQGIEPDVEGKNMKRFLRERGIHIAYARKEAPRFERSHVSVAGERVEAIYRKFRGTFLRQSQKLQPLREYIERGRVRLLFSPLDRLFADKQLLALLSDPETNGFIPPAHRAIVEKAIPWTRLVRSPRCTFEGRTRETVRFLREEQKRLVLKKGEGAGSDGVLVGALCSAENWRDAIVRARKEKSWIVQQMVMRPIRRVPAIIDGKLVDYVNIPIDCPFLIDGQSWGGLAKMSGYHAPPGERPVGPIQARAVAAPIALID